MKQSTPESVYKEESGERCLGRIDHTNTYAEKFSTSLYILLGELKGIDPTVDQLPIEEYISPECIDDLFEEGAAHKILQMKDGGVRMVATSCGIIEIYATEAGMGEYDLSPAADSMCCSDNCDFEDGF